MTVLGLSSCVASRKIPIDFTGASTSQTVFSGSVWCFTVEILHLRRLNDCGTLQSATHQKLSRHEVQAKTNCSEISH